MRKNPEKRESTDGGERGFLRGARSFLLGSAVGASAALAARRRRHRRSQLSDGLAAFEDAPCFREDAERRR